MLHRRQPVARLGDGAGFGSDLAAVQRRRSGRGDDRDGVDSFTGTVDNISALVDPDTRAVAVRVVVDNPARRC